MAWLLHDFDFLSVLLRAFSLGAEALTLGGVVYLQAVLLPSEPGCLALRVARRGIQLAAYGLVFAQTAYIAVDTSILVGSAGLRLTDVLTADYFLAGVAAACCAGIISVCVRREGRLMHWVLGCCAAAILLALVSTSHSVSRLDHRLFLAAMTASHHVGVAVWLGAMPFLLITMKNAATTEEARRMAKRFSPMAIVGVTLLLLGGCGMAWFYIGAPGGASSPLWPGLYGTAYGVMLLAKVYLFLLMLTLGAGNFLLVRQIDHAPETLLKRLRRFGESEIGLGFTALLAAASMTSQPPAVDLTQSQVSLRQIVGHMRPQWPRLTSPPLAALAPPSSIEEEVKADEFGGNTVSDTNDRAWSDYNHHWAGLIVLAAGALALIARVPGGKWARSWPLAFAGLALFILLRADPECWPLGPRPFWASFYSPDVLQHRLYALLILVFAAFEWGVQTGRLKSRHMALIFPGLCAAGGALLLTHNHATTNVSDELLAELSHTPIAVLGATAGWGRWLELRLPNPKESKIASYVWPVCLMLVGLLLLNYRES